jgi:nitrogen fixation NifU-like protein
MNDAAGNQKLQELYREVVLEHARNPRNFYKLEDATHTAAGINPLCGDKIHLYLVVDANQQVTDVSFEGTGCAISMASASLLTETISTLSVPDANACFEAVTSRLTAKLGTSSLRALDGVRQHPSRIKCATLAWQTLNAALQQTHITATTE